jgi:succinyl-CoA synthetase beta subunit
MCKLLKHDSSRGLQGTNAEEGKKLIDESGLKVYSAIVLKEAAELVKKAVDGKL